MSESSPSARSDHRSHALRSFMELLASMRFAIALLTIICIASVIGTVLKQHEPLVNYVNQFGPFWAELFLAIKLNAVYSAWWFLLILAFLVTSTTLCLMRHVPKYLADLRNYKENIREKSLQAFHHKAQNTLAESADA
ncbi:MAG: cytochrome c biogenesis protein ResB, partial [Comamonas sp.]